MTIIIIIIINIYYTLVYYINKCILRVCVFVLNSHCVTIIMKY